MRTAEASLYKLNDGLLAERHAWRRCRHGDAVQPQRPASAAHGDVTPCSDTATLQSKSITCRGVVSLMTLASAAAATADVMSH